MQALHEQELNDLARACSATGTIIEAHSDEASHVCRVIIEMSDGLKHLPLREATLQLWMQDGFIASVSRDGRYLMIDGLIGKEPDGDALALINLVASQIKRYGALRSHKLAEICIESGITVAHLASMIEQPQLRS